jgi:hypothetical protein
MSSSTTMDEVPVNRNEALPGEHVLQRIAWLTLAFGSAAAGTALALRRGDWAEGLAAGTILGWLNFRWLRRGVLAIIRSVAPATEAERVSDSPQMTENMGDTQKSALPAVLLMLFRYALLGLGVYVIFIYLHVPPVSIGLGLCALGAAIMASSVWEVLKPAS